MLHHRTLLLAGLFLGFAVPVGAQVKGPPPPKEYQVRLRYSIPSPRDQHIRLYDEMIRYLKSIGFKYQQESEFDREDPNKNYLVGTVPSANANKLLGEGSIQSALLLPPGYKLPEDPKARVKVDIQLAGGLPLLRQRVLLNQAATLLEDLGFQEAIAYDNRGFTRLVGTIPAGRVETLLKDLRDQPEGWLAPSIPRKELPTPIRDFSPLRIIRVTPEPATVQPIKPVPAPQKPQGDLEKVGRELRGLLDKEDQRGKMIRLEIFLTNPPTVRDRGWRLALGQAAPSLIIEGHIGELVTARVRMSEVPALAGLPQVSTVRLPRPARPRLFPANATPAQEAQALRATGIARIGVPRQVWVAVVDGDFRGYEDAIKNRQLPADTRYVDLTAERNHSLLPNPFPGDPKETGHGTRCARALVRALNGARVELVLVRVDPATPYQLAEVARYVNGTPYHSESSVMRADELDNDRVNLRERRRALDAERRVVLNNYSQEPEDLAQRRAYFKKLHEFEKDERELRERELRYIRIEETLKGLKGTEVVSSSLVWNDGYPVDGGSALSHFFDQTPFRSALWFQAAGDTRGQVWAGLFRDVDGNGVMEFAGPETPPRPGRWTRELNFLGWQPFGKAKAFDLPAGAHLHLSIQWREPHDPRYLKRGEDLYRVPLARLRLVLLRQRDPTGTLLPTDDMEEVSNSLGYSDRYGLPQRLANFPTYAIYEQDLDVTIPAAGRYALRVEGRVPRGIVPRDVPSLPALEKRWELRPRIFVDVTDDATRKLGRPIFIDYATGEGTLGMPADSRGVVTVGAAAGGREAISAPGPAMNLELLPKPNLFVVRAGQEEGDAGLATPAAAGAAAREIVTGTTTPGQYLKGLEDSSPQVLKVP